MLEIYDQTVAREPKHKWQGTSLEYAKLFEPGSREVTIIYTRIPGYRSGRTRPSWGFAISDSAATWSWFNQYTCARRSARRVYAELKEGAEQRGFQVILEVDPETNLSKADIES
ncbi:MAG: hypothetical protein JRD89_02025 [Deltaproteobacteria bacterium]|nr:hypothetical protein [Deltaproteobacteria bacterium]